MNYKIGDTIQLGNITVTVETTDGHKNLYENLCGDCFFHDVCYNEDSSLRDNIVIPMVGYCSRDDREDDMDVVFVN